MMYEIEPTEYIRKICTVSEPELRRYNDKENLIAYIELYDYRGGLIGVTYVDVYDTTIDSANKLREYVFRQLNFIVPIESSKIYTYEVITLS